MFLNTLSIGEWTALNWQKTVVPTKNDSLDPDDPDSENETRPAAKKLRKPRELEALEEFFSTLPKMESHYCRKRTSKLY
jgi:hypothetical protein